MKSRIASLALAFALAALPASVLAASYSEAVSGDISGNRSAPTSLSLDPFTNFISGSVVSGDIDYITIQNPVTVANPFPRIVSLSLTQFDTANPTELAFIGIQAGTQFTEPPTGTNPANLLGYAHVGLPLNVNYLPTMGSAAGAIGFTGDLTGPAYTLWIQQTGANPVNYTIDVYQAPEPSPWAMGLLGLVAWRVGRRFACVRDE